MQTKFLEFISKLDNLTNTLEEAFNSPAFAENFKEALEESRQIISNLKDIARDNELSELSNQLLSIAIVEEVGFSQFEKIMARFQHIGDKLVSEMEKINEPK